MAGNNTTSMVDLGLVGAAWHNPVVYGFRRLFYLCSHFESRFKTVAEVPEYVNQAVPYFISMIALETIILALQGRWKRSMRPNDVFSSLGAGIISLFPMLFVRSIEMSAFIWVHDHWAVMVLPWDSAATWWLCMLGIDFGYYWVHRCAHEVNFMWAGHQVHHSSEDYNLTTALRQSILQRYSSWIFYLPMAFFVPPSVFVVHIQFNLISQFWIHTETINRLGPLEWFLNTPSHHRVHHGRNRYCIDKNYAGVLIIWDRMFGTFEAEKEDDKVVYGLVHPLASWDPIYTQFFHWKYMISKAWEMEGFKNKMSVFLKGPGWEPGKPRTGLLQDIPDIHAPQSSYNKSVSLWMNIYLSTHFVLVLLSHEILVMKKSEFQALVVFLCMVYLLWTLCNIGYFYEHKPFAPYSELLRCVTYLVLDSYICGATTCPQFMYIPRAIFLTSAGMCLVFMTNGAKHKKKAA